MGRQIRLAFLASVLAIVFGVVSIAHAGSHLASENRTDSAAACTLCQHTAASSPAPVVVATPVASIETVVNLVSTLLPAPSLRAHATRGPPMLA